jgi:hypothetical protein
MRVTFPEVACMDVANYTSQILGLLHKLAIDSWSWGRHVQKSPCKTYTLIFHINFGEKSVHGMRAHTVLKQAMPLKCKTWKENSVPNKFVKSCVHTITDTADHQWYIMKHNNISKTEPGCESTGYSFTSPTYLPFTEMTLCHLHHVTY